MMSMLPTPGDLKYTSFQCHWNCHCHPPRECTTPEDTLQLGKNLMQVDPQRLYPPAPSIYFTVFLKLP